ncbi:glycosyl hydrolase [Patulibacter defluvii]|uniref:glycosyl hydrolase n=1 Tax=Patulibacter defluvii TaxID=3095358 RepID=UPI002A75685F|nr:glycosyl hydrolase [Patulibacter sp. DM4]
MTWVNRARRVSALLLIALAAALGLASGASAVVPDPGGDATIDQPVPVSGKLLGVALGADPDRTGGQLTSAIAAMQAAGITHYRDSISWNDFRGYVSPTVPVPSFFDPVTTPIGTTTGVPAELISLDRRYTALVSAGITPVYTNTGAPVWSSRYAPCAKNGTLWATLNYSLCAQWLSYGSSKQGYHPTAAFYPQFQLWVKAVARRYPAAIIEGWNEPDGQFRGQTTAWGWQGIASQPEELAEEHCQLYAAVKSVDPNRIVLSPAFGDTEGTPWYIPGFTTAVGSDRTCWDRFSLHAYVGTTITGDDTPLARLFQITRDARSGISDTTPIWVTEFGLSTTDKAHSSQPANNTEADQKAVVRGLYNKFMAMSDVQAAFPFSLRDNWDIDAGTSTSPKWGYGLARTDWTPKLAFCHFVGQAGNTYTGC